MPISNGSLPGPRFRAAVYRVTPFQTSATACRIRPSHLLGLNESPYDPIPEVAAAIAEAGREVNRYPDLEGARLVAELGRAHGVAADRLTLGAGSAALLQGLFHAVAEPGTDVEVVYGWRSFELYPLLADLAGVRSVAVPLRDGVHDLEGMLGRISERTRMMLICNPNNPTATALGAEHLENLMRQVPSHVLVVLDEAYFEYVRDCHVVSGVQLHGRWPNLVTVRTFSKAYGLAGLRVGYMIGDPAVIVPLRRASLPFSLSTVAQAAALAALAHHDQLLARIDEIVSERKRVRKELRGLGWDVTESHANFLWLAMGAASTTFAEWCAEYGVAVRVFPGEGVRVTIGIPADNDSFLAACEAFELTKKLEVLR